MAIDVSSYQGHISWSKVFGAGVRNAYIKWGESFTVDSFAVENLRNARSAGLDVGLYFYAHPSNSPLKEASWFLRTAGPHLLAGDLPPALDLEVAEGHDWAFLNEWKATWLAAVDAEAGCRAAFYSYYSFWQNMVLYPDRPVWGADLQAGFKPPLTWALHQYSFTGAVPGIQGHVDLDKVLWDPKRVGSGV